MSLYKFQPHTLNKKTDPFFNEDKSFGECEVEFKSHSGEVRNLASEVYFFQLKVGSFIQSKKMILIK